MREREREVGSEKVPIMFVLVPSRFSSLESFTSLTLNSFQELHLLLLEQVCLPHLEDLLGLINGIYKDALIDALIFC